MDKPKSKRTHSKNKKSTMKSFLNRLIICIRYCIDIIIDTIFGWYYNPKRECIPEIKNTIVLESASSLAKKIRKREFTSEEVVQAFVDRIKEVNPMINAIVDDRFEEALKEAREIDKDIASGHLAEADFLEKPFLGVPFTSKESTAAKGLSFTFGLKKRLNRKATFDADCVDAMKQSGAILLGVSNIPQLNLWQETSNPVYGLTKNPYNTTRNVGGSSGGESSILAACGSPMGIGTDIGGSCRIPAFMCGVFGHKISNNMVSTKGLTFRTGEESDTMVSVGAMTRYAEDLIPFIKALIGPKSNKLNLDQAVPIRKVRVYFVTNPKDPLMSPFREEMHASLLKAVSHFEEICDEKPEELVFEYLRHQFKLWKYWMSVEPGVNFKNDINNRKGEVNSLLEILKHFTPFLGSDYSTATIFNLCSGYLKQVDPVWAKETTEDLKKALLSKLDDNSVLLYPSAPFPASYHHTALLRPFNFDCFAIWNVLKFPVTQVPMGLDRDGLPLGIQVVAAPNQDRLCVAVAKELERVFGGFVSPSTVTIRHQ